MTSHDVVDAVRRIAGQREVGHTGTLDPAATGLLVLCLGEATRLSEYFTRMVKGYTGDMILGAVSDTHDAEGEITAVQGAKPVDEERLRHAAEGFVGEIVQVPPVHSAKKIGGRKLYEYARAGEEVEIPPRTVEVHRFVIDEYAWPRATFEVVCGSGTYVRRLVHDLGEDLGCGAYLSALRRVRVGSFSVGDALTLGQLGERDEALAEALWPVRRALAEWPTARVNDEGLVLLRRGHALPAGWAPLADSDRPMAWLDPVLLLDAGGNALAVAQYVPAPSSPPPRALSEYRGAWFQPIKQFRYL